MNALRLGTIAVALVCLSAGAALADYVQDFETLTYGAPVGVPLTGQDGYYIPSGTTSVDWLCYTYLLNTYSITQNPNGGIVFVAGEGPGDGATYARAQHAIALTDQVWEFAYDFCCFYTDPGQPAANNLGSFSSQPAPNDFIALFEWEPGFEGTIMRHSYIMYDATGAQFLTPYPTGGPDWENLALNHWYRGTMKVDFTLNKCVEVTIADIQVGGAPVSYVPTDWYLEGGSAGSTADMTDFRLFAGGGAPGNVVAIDNVSIRELGATPVEPTTWGNLKASFR
jgi:hypothetical protein